jgi:DNA-directed RNA polymerase subunit RPC12/RpoP
VDVLASCRKCRVPLTRAGHDPKGVQKLKCPKCSSTTLAHIRPRLPRGTVIPDLALILK